MVKQSRKKLRRQKRKSYRKKTRKMVGGNFTQEENQQLLDMGFTQADIQALSNTGLRLNIIQMSLTQVNPATGALFTPQELIQSINETNQELDQLDISGISNASDDEHILNDYYDDSMNTTQENILNDSYDDSMNTTQENISNISNNDSLDNGSLHLSDLDNFNNNSANTTREEVSFGGRKRKTSRNYTRIRKGRKHVRKTRKQRGGMCFGNGVGANSYDPNYSIYNTNMLKLFPYKS